MSDEERAERLFRIGYPECVNRQYDMCVAAMKRVTSIRPSFRAAFRLQAWASAQRDSQAPREPMPDVGPVETLMEYELDQSGRASSEGAPAAVGSGGEAADQDEGGGAAGVVAPPESERLEAAEERP